MRFLLLYIVLLTSCAIDKGLKFDRAVGSFTWNKYDFESGIELNSDSTFKYSWISGLNAGITIGRWSLEGKEIILNSNRQKSSDIREEDFKILNKEIKDIDFLKISVVDSEGRPLIGVCCGLKSDTSFVNINYTDINGEVILPESQADSLIVSYIGYKLVRFRLDEKINSYEIEMKDANDYYRYFDNERWKRKSNSSLVEVIKEEADKPVKRIYKK